VIIKGPGWNELRFRKRLFWFLRKALGKSSTILFTMRRVQENFIGFMTGKTTRNQNAGQRVGRGGRKQWDELTIVDVPHRRQSHPKVGIGKEKSLERKTSDAR